MKSTFAVTMPIMAAAGALANAHSNIHHVRAPMPGETGPPRINVATLQGCFKTFGNMTTQEVDEPQFLSSGKCTKACIANGQYVAAISPSVCYCGMVYPPKDDKVDDSDCNYPCSGYGQEMCGGPKDAFSVYNNGNKDGLAPGNYNAPSSSSTTSTSSSASSTSTSAATTTQSQASETSKPEKSGGGPNTAAIAAGVVVGVVVAAAIIGAIIFFIRRKRNAEIEEEHRRNAAVNAFISGSKPPSTSGGISITDSRLDPVMAHRRLSDGSIADNQDYSRKILRVTNA